MGPRQQVLRAMAERVASQVPDEGRKLIPEVLD
jgi:hypothetical protein